MLEQILVGVAAVASLATNILLCVEVAGLRGELRGMRAVLAVVGLEKVPVAIKGGA